MKSMVVCVRFVRRRFYELSEDNRDFKSRSASRFVQRSGRIQRDAGDGK